MSQGEYSAEDVIDRYGSLVVTTENHLLEFEEEAKRPAPDESWSSADLEEIAYKWAPPILESYDRAERMKEDEIDGLKQQLEYVLDNPNKRYPHLPQSLAKHEDMNEEIEDLNQSLDQLDEWISYDSYELEQETGNPLEYYASGPVQHYMHRLQNQVGSSHLNQFQQKLSEDPELATCAGALVVGAGILAADYIKNWIDD